MGSHIGCLTLCDLGGSILLASEPSLPIDSNKYLALIAVFTLFMGDLIRYHNEADYALGIVKH